MSRRILAALLIAAAGWCAALEVPYLAGRVTDLANLVAPGTEERLDRKLAELERETGAQVAVLTVPSLEGDPLEDFALRVVETWQLGREGVDDGVLLLVSKDDRKVRIEVGYGLEATLTDVQSKRIISSLMIPRFREGDFDGGVEAAVDAVAGTVRGQEDLIPVEAEATSFTAMPLAAKIFYFGVFFMVVGMFSLLAAASTGPGAWVTYVFLMPFYLAFPAAALGVPAGLVALGLWIVVFPILHRKLRGRRIGPRSSGGRRGGSWSRGSWSRGGFGGAFSSRGGGFSGGFSGGGGSFGGGGASGSW